MAKIEIYTTRICPYCVRAKKLLTELGQEFIEIDASDPDVRAAMIDRAEGRTTVPEIFIDDKLIGGCDDLYALHNRGGLEPLLGNETSG
ncbi:MAG: glutaredoxin 3 [Planctomycetes bacterium]|nr:glutaredoxin 3 [Planctomycetota bacterium]